MANPNITKRREVTDGSAQTFPIEENLERYVALRFIEYSRLVGNESPTEKGTATIFLPYPQNIPDNMSIRTSRHDLGISGGIIDAAVIEAFKLTDQGAAPLLDKLKSFSEGNGSTNKAEIARLGLALAPGISDNLRTKASIATGVVKNPYTTTFFEGVDLRSFTLSWRMSPRSEEESIRLKNIVDTIELRMHPEELASGFALNYPDLVYVDFIGTGSEYMPKYRKSFISSIQKSRGDQQWYTSGAPITFEMSISFNEVEIITRNTLRDDKGISTGSGTSPVKPGSGPVTSGGIIV